MNDNQNVQPTNAKQKSSISNWKQLDLMVRKLLQSWFQHMLLHKARTLCGYCVSACRNILNLLNSDFMIHSSFIANYFLLLCSMLMKKKIQWKKISQGHVGKHLEYT